MTWREAAFKLSAMGRILAVDWGRRKIGLAISDELKMVARPLKSLVGLPRKEALLAIRSIVESEGVDTVIVGHPAHLNGREGTSAAAAKELASEIRNTAGTPVVKMWDERLTSVEAERLLRELGERPARTSDRLDQISAALLLQSYLDSAQA